MKRRLVLFALFFAACAVAVGPLSAGELAFNLDFWYFNNTVGRPDGLATFRVACLKGMHLLQPNCISVEELRDAQVHPECHRDIIIKVCGFSARFVSRSRRWQDEIIARHACK